MNSAGYQPIRETNDLKPNAPPTHPNGPHTEKELIEFTMNSGFKLVARADSIDDDGESIIGELADGRQFGFALSSLSHVVEVV